MLSSIGMFWLLVFLPCLICAQQVETFYGLFEVEEPVLLELIDSPAFQRLKAVRQYGVGYYIGYPEEYTRYDHSLGVFVLLRAKGLPLEEQIAGLLHDVSHTAFSHVGDWVFGSENQEKGYQDKIHRLFLAKSGLEEILNRHGFEVENILPEGKLFPALEKSLPNLCADRIDYNIQGAYHRGWLTRDEVKEAFDDLEYKDGCWISHQPELMKKIAQFSIFMSYNCWGGSVNYCASRWLADAMLRAIELEVISLNDIHFGTDQLIWDILLAQADPVIVKNMRWILEIDERRVLAQPEEAHVVVTSKFRGIDPWIELDAGYSRLTSLDAHFATEYEEGKKVCLKGWAIREK
jgi:uncharacterized protein